MHGIELQVRKAQNHSFLLNTAKSCMLRRSYRSFTHTKRHSMFSVGGMSLGWKNASSHISHMTKWVLCTMWWVHISTEDHYGMRHWQGPRYFFIPFHFGHRAGSFVRASDRWARTKPHSHNPTLPITQSSVASLSQADDGPDETGSKQTESWKRGKPFPLHYKGTQHAGVLLLWKWWHSKKVNVNRTWLIGLFDCLNLFFFYAFIFLCYCNLKCSMQFIHRLIS